MHEELPPGAVSTGSVNTTGHVDIYRNGDLPRRPFYCLAKVAAHGNADATHDTLETTLESETLKLNADCLLLTAENVTNDGTIGSYGGGLFSSTQIKRPHLYGVACKYSQVKLGINQDKDHVVSYVSDGSPAATAGIVEGDKILAINGVSIASSPFVTETEVSTKKPGDTVTIEFLNKSGKKERKVITLSGS
ncbi:PDZ domain-containing protein [Paraburkholderia silviterrae]|uniref:PDZ domain-containing protein n=1 Tax=Paraburkholderia silviterrae TaxID=2528715 RepID=UPI001404FE9B|nr:PDZ domain-containing protein [Paraburkholderia silviterrae]